tara:strand:+ start:64 stop:411 length:348 start_codon:yes stop_codon:yes gene_type:complete
MIENDRRDISDIIQKNIKICLLILKPTNARQNKRDSEQLTLLDSPILLDCDGVTRARTKKDKDKDKNKGKGKDKDMTRSRTRRRIRTRTRTRTWTRTKAISLEQCLLGEWGAQEV